MSASSCSRPSGRWSPAPTGRRTPTRPGRPTATAPKDCGPRSFTTGRSTPGWWTAWSLWTARRGRLPRMPIAAPRCPGRSAAAPDQRPLPCSPQSPQGGDQMTLHDRREATDEATPAETAADINDLEHNDLQRNDLEGMAPEASLAGTYRDETAGQPDPA